jgi:hypothetical protein
MKKVLIYTGLAVFILSGCTKDITDFNKNPKAPEEVPAAMLYANAQKDLVYYMSSPNVNVNTFRLWSQHWTQTTYTDESNYELTERNINGGVYDRLYANVLRDLSEARAIIGKDELVTGNDEKAQLALITIIECYAYHVLVDIFNDVPYTDAIQLLDNLAPGYDDAATIYSSVMSDLDGAIADLNAGGGTGELGASDNIYGGSASSWAAFAGALKMKMAVRTGDMAAAAAADPGAGFSSAMMTFEGSAPNTNPLWEALVQSGRTDYIASSTFGDILNDRMDPRRGMFFKNVGDSIDGGKITGNPHGSGGAYPLYSQPGAMLEDPTHPGQLMTTAEVEFLRAHIDATNDDDAAAATHYHAGIMASCSDWGVDGSTYIMHPMVNADSLLAAGTSWNEIIGTQKWIAMYDNSFEAWSTWRFYDYPMMAVAAEAGTTPPTRYNYSVDEYSINNDNVSGANGGNDDKYGKVFSRPIFYL